MGGGITACRTNIHLIGWLTMNRWAETLSYIGSMTFMIELGSDWNRVQKANTHLG